jgi:hypothetical protein
MHLPRPAGSRRLIEQPVAPFSLRDLAGCVAIPFSDDRQLLPLLRARQP